jgi:nitroimidazol reductase NimA-like FMN-containing flavoprotein (pyridoxamine 5'-phosphate oxidase superfamily)
MADARDVYRSHPTDAEIADVLELREVATLGTVNEDGSVHLAYAIFLHEDGRLYLETSSVTRKARNASRRGHASLLVQGRASTGRTLMVAAEGRARVITGDEAHEIRRRILAKYVKPEALAGIHRAFGRFDDVAIEITPVRWRSWTNTVLRREAEREIAGPYSEVWLPDDE